MQVQRETHILRCAQCQSAGPSDPFARFCANCGAVMTQLAGQRLPSPEGGQVALCVTCKSLVPANTPTCLICEAFISQLLQPQTNLSLQDHAVCVSCGSGNPADISRCLTCDSHLQPVQLEQTGCGGNSAPFVRAADQMLTCFRCKRLNCSDARFCNWCGSKTCRAHSVTCCRCGASGHPYAFYCSTCGSFLEGPAPPISRSDVTKLIAGATISWAPPLAMSTLSPTPSVKVIPPTVNQSTQTIGLFFPSATELQRKEQQSAAVTRQRETRILRPPLTAISPGRGYWRKQLDHVSAHLRSYTQNNAPFRAVLGEPRLGQVVSAVIQEDLYEVSLTISFVSVKQKQQQVGSELICGEPGGSEAVGQTETLSSVTERSADSTSVRSDQLSDVIQPKPSVVNNQLLKELDQGRGRISTIQQLLDQGADPSYCRSNGRHPLVVAVLNGHHNILPLLVQRGADVDQQSGPMKNTALHEAAALGSEGLRSAELLLRCKASVMRRNAAGLTVSDVAMSSGCRDMASLMVAQTRSDFLDKLGRPQMNLGVF